MMMFWTARRATSCVVTFVDVLSRHSLALHRCAARTESLRTHCAQDGSELTGFAGWVEWRR